MPAGVSIFDVNYWQATNWATVMTYAVADANVPNVSARVTQDLQYQGDGIVTEFSAGTVYSAAETYTTLVFIDNVLQSTPGNYSYDNDTGIIEFSTAPAFGSPVRIVAARMVLSVTNSDAAPAQQTEGHSGNGHFVRRSGF